ncbi:MAG: pilus assembly protein PilM [Verrucomicrobia bacterium]|nr:pilus assembly protein PilM [Verrucomicrobiota bacterium]
MNWPPRRRLQSILGLSLADGQLRAAHVARSKNAVAVLRTASAPLALDLLHPEPELVGREIRNHLEAAHIRERHCVVALPASWVMSQHVSVPDLSPEDTASLLQIEAEKGFPCSPEELQIAPSAHRVGSERYVTQLAVRQEQIAQLGEVLKSAGLKPLSYTLGLAALPESAGAAGKGRISLLVEPKGATLLVAAGGGFAAYRTLEATIESEFGEHVLNGPAIARELRITFEQIPAGLRPEIRTLALRGDAALTEQLAGILGDWAREAGLEIDLGKAGGRPVSEVMIEQLAESYLRAGSSALEFLPPRPSRWAQLLARYNSRRLATAGFAAAAAALVAAVAFGWQEFRLWSLRSEWEGMAARVASYRNLTILRRVVECFPDNGSVTAKTFEIHGPATVSVSGTARDNASLLRTLDQLRQAKEVQGLKIEQIRGKTPAQFTFTFRWVGTSGT